MARVNVTYWLDNYRGFIGYITDQQADSWSQVIRANRPKATKADVDKAVALICSKDRDSRSAKPGALEIIRAIDEINYKDSSTGQPVSQWVKLITITASGSQHRSTRHIDELTNALDHCDDPVRAWELICSPVDTAHSRLLEDHARKHGIRYERFVPDMNYDDLSRTIVNEVDELEEAPF